MTHPIDRRTLVAAIGASLLSSPLSGWAQRADYPNRPVTVIVPFVPGGNADSTARIFAEFYGKQLGQQFVIENKGGAGGMIGAAQLVRAEPDGYTIMIGTTGPIIASWQMAGKAATYGLKDMKPVALLTLVPGVIVVNASSPIRTYQDLVTHGKARPGELKFGHPGNGTAGHVNILQMQKALDQKFIVAGYKGAGPAVQDLMGGHLDAVATDLPSALQLVKAGKLRALAVVFPQRAAALPDMPTMQELKQPEVDIAPFTATMAPRNVPAAVVERLIEATDAALADPQVRKQVEAIGGIPTRMTRAEFDHFLAGQAQTYAGLISSGLLVAD